MTAAAFHLARSCVLPDEAYGSLDALGAALFDLADGRELTIAHAVLARREPSLLSGPCLAVRAGCPATWRTTLLAYAFIRPLDAEGATALRGAIAFAQICQTLRTAA